MEHKHSKLWLLLLLLLLLFDIFVPTNAHPLLALDVEWFVQMYFKISLMISH